MFCNFSVSVLVSSACTYILLMIEDTVDEFVIEFSFVGL